MSLSGTTVVNHCSGNQVVVVIAVVVVVCHCVRNKRINRVQAPTVQPCERQRCRSFVWGGCWYAHWQQRRHQQAAAAEATKEMRWATVVQGALAAGGRQGNGLLFF